MANSLLSTIIQEGSRIVIELARTGSKSTTQELFDPHEFIEQSHQRMSKFAEPLQPEDTAPAESPAAASPAAIPTPEPVIGKASAIATGCVPCAMGHFGTCSGILNESVRFAHSPDGMGSIEVADRVGMCLDELNAMERVDLRPEMTTQLNGWEKDLAQKALAESRAIRHDLENLKSVDQLEATAARIQTSRKDIGRAWFQNKLATMSPEDKAEVSRRVMKKVDQMVKAEAEGG